MESYGRVYASHTDGMLRKVYASHTDGMLRKVYASHTDGMLRKVYASHTDGMLRKVYASHTNGKLQKGCLTNASTTSTITCTGLFCTMVQRFEQSSYNITAGCNSSCTEEDQTTGNVTVRTRCCQRYQCNKDDEGIVALVGNGGSATSPTLVWILSIILFIAAFKILM
ncbi:hypothetical protein CHS0354_027702 [Potamilus streckersoni]|uniref:Uncharacterized protein n=1 Tax=Potamilus streckersoni TaxID=2493646 RepID=A0AAE0WC32_9BIVA|nr:hypothetical protein CHS0354_027702 [Potamilus streckersoni]